MKIFHKIFARGGSVMTAAACDKLLMIDMITMTLGDMIIIIMYLKPKADHIVFVIVYGVLVKENMYKTKLI